MLHKDTTVLHKDTTVLHKDTTVLHKDTTVLHDFINTFLWYIELEIHTRKLNNIWTTEACKEN